MTTPYDDGPLPPHGPAPQTPPSPDAPPTGSGPYAEVLGGPGGTPPPGPPPGPPTGKTGAGDRSLGRWVGIGVGAAAVVAVGAGVAFGVQALRGGGTQPEDVLPADTMAMAKVDFDPSAGQKVGAIRFLRKFPDLRGRFQEEGDPRKALFELVKEDNDDLRDVDFDRDLEPWLGQRAAVAVRPGQGKGNEPDVVVALQVSDQGKARAGIRRLAEKAGDDPADVAIVLRNGYAILAEEHDIAQRAADAAAKGSLAKALSFTADLDRLGETGVAMAWGDVGAAAKAAPEAFAGKPSTGRVAVAVRFEGGDLEMSGFATGAAAGEAGGSGATRIAKLPESTVAAVGLTHADERVRRTWTTILTVLGSEGADGMVASFVDELKQRYGITLPDDLATLVGSSTTLSVDGQGLPGEPRVGLRSVTDPDKAVALLERIDKALRDQGVTLPLVVRKAADGVAVATTEDYAAALAADGSLGSSPGFRAALPDADTADATVYADVDRLVHALPDEVVDDRNLAVVDAVGLSVVVSEDGTGATIRMRVVTK